MRTGLAVVLQREGGMPEKADVHSIGLLGRRGVRELLGQLEADGDADEHAQARLLGHERAHGQRALLGLAHLRGVGDRGLVRAAEPAALGERAVEDALKPGCGVGHDLLGVGEALGVAKGLHGRVDLLGGVAGLHRPQRTR